MGSDSTDRGRLRLGGRLQSTSLEIRDLFPKKNKCIFAFAGILFSNYNNNIINNVTMLLLLLLLLFNVKKNMIK